MGEERSPGGSIIQRHREAVEPRLVAPYLPAYHDEIVNHLETFLGPCENVFHEIVSDRIHVDVLQFPPTENRKFWTLVTCGMSDQPMAAPDGLENPSLFERAEVVISLPPEWLDSEGPEELARNGKWWPVEVIRFAARFPHLYNTWLWFGHTLSLENPPRPFDAHTKFCAFLVAFPLRWSEYQFNMVARDGRSINFLSIVPLYAEELQFKLDMGTDALFNLLDDAGVSEFLDPTRPNIVLKN